MNKIVLLLVLVGIVVFAIYTSKRAVAPGTQATNNANVLTSPSSGIAVETSDVAYFGKVKGFFARPLAEGNYPGVVMIHEWWGLNDNIKTMARELAKQGYLVLAVDLYDGTVATTQAEAMKQVQSLDQQKAIENLRGSVNYLRTNGATRMATLGWCFGGGQSMQYALSGDQLDATVIYYGTPVTDQKKLMAIDWPVLGIFGDKDQSIPVATVQEFEKGLKTVGVKNEIHIYPGVGHAFANPSGQNYAPNETKDAWAKTLSFLAANLK